MQKFKSVDELIHRLKPESPVYCIRRDSINLASELFQKKFPGKILYAIKTNPHSEVLKTIINSGIDNFDFASIKELQTIKEMHPTAKCFYMNTVKSRENIKEAYYNYKIKKFSLMFSLLFTVFI